MSRPSAGSPCAPSKRAHHQERFPCSFSFARQALLCFAWLVAQGSPRHGHSPNLNPGHLNRHHNQLQKWQPRFWHISGFSCEFVAHFFGRVIKIFLGLHLETTFPLFSLTRCLHVRFIFISVYFYSSSGHKPLKRDQQYTVYDVQYIYVCIIHIYLYGHPASYSTVKKMYFMQCIRGKKTAHLMLEFLHKAFFLWSCVGLSLFGFLFCFRVCLRTIPFTLRQW